MGGLLSDKTIKVVESKEYDPEKIREFARNFDFSVFKDNKSAKGVVG